MGNINVDKSILDAVQKEVASGEANLSGSLDSLIRQMEAGKEAWHSSENIDFDGVISTLKSIQSDYADTNQQFMQTLNESVAAYQEQDMSVQSQMNSEGTSPVITAGGAGSSGGPSSGPANVSTNGTSPVIEAGSASKTSTKTNREKGDVDYDSTSPESFAKQGYAVPQGSSGPGVRATTVDANGNVTYYTNSENGIQGTVIDINDPSLDPRVKALANMGGEVVRLDDGRLAVRDQYGGGTIFNSDGTTMDVSSKTIHAGTVEKVSASSGGVDPYSQELADQLIKDGYSDKKIEKMVNKWEEKGQIDNPDGVLTAVEQRREEASYAKETSIPLVSSSPSNGVSGNKPVQAQPSPGAVQAQSSPTVTTKSPVINAGASKKTSSDNPFVEHRRQGDQYQ